MAKITVDESYLNELTTTIISLRADLWFIARLFDKKNGVVTREDFQQALKERRLEPRKEEEVKS